MRFENLGNLFKFRSVLNPFFSNYRQKSKISQILVIARLRDLGSRLHKLEIYGMIFFSTVLAFKILQYIVFTDCYHVRVKSKQNVKKSRWYCYFTVHLLEDFYTNQFAEKLHEYDDSNKKK